MRTRDAVADLWGPRSPYVGEGDWPERVDQQTTEEPERWVQSCCVMCSNGCGLDIGVKDGRIVGVRGRGDDRVSRGRLGPKGMNSWQANASPDRLTRPRVRTGARLVEASWDDAMSLIVERCQAALRDFTPDSVGIYNSGQLFIEDYYTLSLLAHAGIGTSQIDGNTRLCTATAGAALRESFGSDGQAASYSDVDVTECLFLVGSNLASNQTVLWSRILDRLEGPRSPKLIVVDPRLTATAREADVHLAPRLGTNVALLNGLIRWLIANDRVDPRFIEEHTVGFDELRRTVEEYTPERASELTGVSAANLVRAAELLGSANSLLSACLQGVYQSNQATAAACQVNNIHLLRGFIGRPGSGVLQMNGQPTAQNTRETGCDGDFPFFMNYENPEHLARLAKLWNVEPSRLPHWHVHGHVMEIFRHAELGSLKFLWIIGTNPAVSLPELARIRSILAKQDLFVVVQDAFPTETTELADVVLPAAMWGEKTGTFTNADRTVHLSDKAIEPPGEARPDFDIFLDFARRMDFCDRDGGPLVPWSTPEEAFDRWAADSRGWYVDYSGLSYAKLRTRSGIPWPCNAEHPDGAERIYTDQVFHTAAATTQSYGHDLETGASRTRDDYLAHDPAGRAIFKAAKYLPPQETPDATYPFSLTTGRVVYHFHTRTKTARCPELNAAAPEVFVEISAEDAGRLGIAEGEPVEIASRRGTVTAPARISPIPQGCLFLPFHYGNSGNEPHTAANELTITAWDPVSKQPTFKFAAVQVRKPSTLRDLGTRVADAAGKAAHAVTATAENIMSATHRPHQKVNDYLARADKAWQELGAIARQLTSQHPTELELVRMFERIGEWSDEARAALRPFVEQRPAQDGEPAAMPPRLRAILFPHGRSGPSGILEDLHALAVLAQDVRMGQILLWQAACGLRDLEGFLAVVEACDRRLSRTQDWLVTELRHRATHTLIVPS